MRFYIIVLLAAILVVLLNCPRASAQTGTAETSTETEKAGQDDLEKKILLAGRLKTSGIILTSCGLGLLVPGIALTVTGAVMVAVNFVLLQWGSLTGWGAVYAAGVILTSVGAAALLPGIPLWVVGAVREKKYRKMGAARPLVGIDPYTGTFTFGVGYTF